MFKPRLALASAAVVAALSIHAQAAFYNPETFESYPTPDPAWNPDFATTGWQVDTAHGQTNAIDSTYGSSGNGLQITMNDDNFNGYAYWDGHLDINTVPQQLFQMDFRLVEPDNLGYVRTSGAFRIGPAYNYHAAWAFTKASPSATPSATLYFGNDGGGGSPVAIPGGDALAIGQYYTMQVEIDYAAETVRARFGPVGGPYNAWTPDEPLGLNDTTQYSGIEWSAAANGTVDFDNISLVDNAPVVPEPASAAAAGLLSAGLMFRRPGRRV